jgi:hypothetical protein
MLGEGPAEAAHVRDNGMKRRHASTTETCEQLRLRICALGRLTDTRIKNITAVEERAQANKRAKVNYASRGVGNGRRMRSSQIKRKYIRSRGACAGKQASKSQLCESATEGACSS